MMVNQNHLFHFQGGRRTNGRVLVQCKLKHCGIKRRARRTDDGSDLHLGSRSVMFDRMIETQIYRGELLPPGEKIAGPAIFEFFGTTIVVGPSQDAIADEDGNVIIRVRH